MGKVVEKLVGPRVPLELLREHPVRYRLPGVVLSLARIAILVSLFVPYWQMTLHAPQYPDELHVSAYINRLTGDVTEIDGLNHYIGMRPLNEAAQLERSLSIAMLIALILLVEGATHVHSKWAVALVLPAILFPFFFLIDLHLWMSHFGQNLDPTAPLSSAIKPFTPPVLGVGVVGQFKTVASPGLGLILAVSGSFLTVVGLFFHRRAFKPLYDHALAG